MAYINDKEALFNVKCDPDSVYPVGSIYMSVNNTSPSTLFGGTWTRIQDKFLLAAGSSYSAGSTGGEAKHTLTPDEMPTHTHEQTISNGHWSYGMVYSSGGEYSDYSGGAVKSDYFNTSAKGRYARTKDSGKGEAHNNMPPYLAVYMWVRTA